MHEINTECLQRDVSEVFKCISHESDIEYIVQFVVFTPCIDIECILQFHHVIYIHYGASFHPSHHHNTIRKRVWGYCSKNRFLFVTPLFAPFLAVSPELSLGMFVVFQVISKCLDHNGFERTVDQFQRVLELNAVVFDLHFFVLGGGNDFQISVVFFVHLCDEFHFEGES